MQFSELWLRSLCNPALDSDALCHLLTMAGLEVEEVEAVAPPFTGVLVARIVSFEKHPNADKLKLCQVDIGRGDFLQIVCGAPNVVTGMKAPCAIVGARLPGFEIKAAKLRGVESFGMLCSADELGMPQEHDGLLVLPEDAPIGSDIRDYLALDDRKITIKLTPNRADCLSLTGIARELAALTGSPLNLPAVPAVPATNSKQREVRLEAPQACPRYLGRVVSGVDATAPTPEWMRQRLARCGVRSISAVVDITNYVMLELGQPLHAFDNEKLSGAIRVRTPLASDSLHLLNGQVVSPSADTLLITDEARVLALAGVMGGEESGVSEATREVFLESAFFSPNAIVGRARALGFSSDASHRFERGVDFALAAQAMERATALLLEVCGGEPGPVVAALVSEALPVRTPVTFRPLRARSVLGVAVPDAQMRSAFEKLGFILATNVGEAWQVTPPTYRFDIEIEEDLIEEVARVFGYENIPPLAPVAPTAMLARTETARPVHALRHQIADRDYQEIISFAFVEESWEADFCGNTDPIRLANPIASQMSVMRSSLFGGLLGALSTNLRRRAPRVRLFEIGRCFVRDSAGLPVEGYHQPQRLAGLAWGSVTPEQWGEVVRKVDFYDVKADVECFLPGAVFASSTHPALHPGRCASVSVNGRAIGVLGELHPAWVQKYELMNAPVLFELELEAVLAAKVPAYQELTRQPAVQRDIALVVPADLPVGRLIEVLKSVASPVVQSLQVFDVYTGKGVEAHHKSVALRAVLQHTERTLEEAEIEQAMRGVIEQAVNQFGAQLRA